MVVRALFKPNISALLEPISGNNPCGEALRYTEVYDQIREARREEDEKLPQGVWKSEIKKADWNQVSHLCEEVLKNRSKDLQVAAWLTEAWLRLEGIQGLSEGLNLILGLTRTFWEGIYPQIHNENYEFRIVPYEWINTRLSEECHYIPVSMPIEKTVLSYTFLDFNEANRLEITRKGSEIQKTSQTVDTAYPPLTKIASSIDQTPISFYRDMDASCNQALKLIAELEEELRLHLEEEAPTFLRLKNKIKDYHLFIRQILDKRGENMKKITKTSVEKPPRIQSHKQPTPLSIVSREQAYAILGEVANYLEQIEPHSPTPYLIHRAIAWGGMSLAEVFADTLKNGKDMSLILDILNIKKE